MHYNAYEIGVLGGKCIIMQFLGMGKSNIKGSQPSYGGQRRERRSEEDGDGGDSGTRQDSRSENVSYRRNPGPPKGGPYDLFFSLSPLLAFTCIPDRCKSFISIDITNDPRGWGYASCFGMLLM
jgi:hypothetical protein